MFGDFTAMVLAGGLGTRLRSIVADRPKVLATVAGRPFLAYLLDQLAKVGLSRVVLCTGHQAELVEQTFGSAYGPLELAYSRESRPLGTGGALRAALPQVATQSILALNGDSYCQADLAAFLGAHQAHHAAATLLLTQVDDAARFGQVQTDEVGRVVRFSEKAPGAGPGWINAGIYLLQRRVLESIAPDEEVSLERIVFPAWIGRGLHGHRGGEAFLDIGTPESYTAAEKFFLTRGCGGTSEE